MTSETIAPDAVRAALEAATPGPWRIVPYDAGDKDEWSMWTPLIDGSKDADRAVVHWAGFRQKYWQSADGRQSEIEANARLIAMAPDLATAYLALAEENERLRAWQAASFLAHPNIDLDIEASPEALSAIKETPHD